MAAWYDRYITMKANIQGGAPIIRGTRTSVRSVVETLRVSNGDIAEVRRALAYLSSDEIDAALDYYQDNPQRVDADINRHNRAIEQFFAQA